MKTFIVTTLALFVSSLAPAFSGLAFAQHPPRKHLRHPSRFLSPLQKSQLDEVDLRGYPARKIVKKVLTTLQPDGSSYSQPTGGGLRMNFSRMNKGKPEPVGGLRFNVPQVSGPSRLAYTDMMGNVEIPECKQGFLNVQIALELPKYFSIGSGGTLYKISFQAPCGVDANIFFKADSQVGQAVGIWQTALNGWVRLKSTVGLEFWSKPIEFNWPADGDYYSFGEVSLTRGDHWDVVGHEFGHAIYDLANMGVFGGGQHYIDRCYTSALALSEGWASFFAGWLNFDLRDSDPHFEFMVPRRAPIQIENIPSDVCRGQTSEWRVSGFFWDLIDLHSDPESADFSFAAVWKALAGRRSSSVGSAIETLKKSGFDAAKIDQASQASF